MALELAKAFVRIVVDKTGLKKGFDGAEKETKGRMAKLGKSVRLIAGAAIGAGAGAALLVAGKRALDTADAYGKLSQRVQVSTEDLSRLSYAASLNDLSFEQLGNSLKFFRIKIDDANRGNERIRDSFASVGLSMDEVNAHANDLPGLIGKIADAYANNTVQGDKTVTAMRIFGEEVGLRIIPLLNQGSEGLREFAAESDKAGFTVSTKFRAPDMGAIFYATSGGS